MIGGRATKANGKRKSSPNTLAMFPGLAGRGRGQRRPPAQRRRGERQSRRLSGGRGGRGGIGRSFGVHGGASRAGRGREVPMVSSLTRGNQSEDRLSSFDFSPLNEV